MNAVNAAPTTQKAAVIDEGVARIILRIHSPFTDSVRAIVAHKSVALAERVHPPAPLVVVVVVLTAVGTLRGPCIVVSSKLPEHVRAASIQRWNCAISGQKQCRYGEMDLSADQWYGLSVVKCHTLTNGKMSWSNVAGAVTLHAHDPIGMLYVADAKRVRSLPRRLVRGTSFCGLGTAAPAAAKARGPG